MRKLEVIVEATYKSSCHRIHHVERFVFAPDGAPFGGFLYADFSLNIRLTAMQKEKSCLHIINALLRTLLACRNAFMSSEEEKDSRVTR